MRSLLDVNVLLALIDGDHVHHSAARRWTRARKDPSWASCAITQNGFVRILSQPSYAHTAPLQTAMTLLEQACSGENHEYWPCDVSILDPAHVDRSKILGPKQLTDLYLLALATAHGGRFVTFDRGISLAAVPAATTENLVVI